MKFAVFVSGKGTNLQAIIEAVKTKEINAQLVLVYSNKRKAYGLKRAEAAGIKTLYLNPKDYTNKQSFERDLVIHLKEAGVDFIVLAGYMLMLTPFFVKTFPKQILNIHPSLLPSFKGANGIKDTFTYGTKVAGVTVHIVNDKMDHGPIIAQDSFKLTERETLESLEERIHALEHKVYPKAIAHFVDGKCKIRGRKVKILEKPQEPSVIS